MTEANLDFVREGNCHIETFEKNLKQYLKKTSKIRRVLKIIMGSKSNPQFQYNFFFSFSYRKTIYTKVDEEVKNREIFSANIDDEKIIFCFQDRSKEDLKDFKNKSYKFNPNNYIIEDDKISINYNGIFAPFGDFHYFPELLNSRYVFSHIFPCQFDDINESNTIEKMKTYCDKFNNVVIKFIEDNKINKVAFNAISMGSIKFVFSAPGLIKKIEELNLLRKEKNQSEIDLTITIIHPIEELNKTVPYYINRKIKKLFKINLKGFIGYFAFKKLPSKDNIIFKKRMNEIIVYFIINIFKLKNFKLRIAENSFISHCLLKKSLKEVIAYSFASFTPDANEDEKKLILEEISKKLNKTQVYTLYYDDGIGHFDLRNCFFNINVNYNSSTHDEYTIDNNYIPY